MEQSKDGALGDRMVAGGAWITFVGLVVGFIGIWTGFWFTLVAGVIGIAGFLLMTFGAGRSGKSLWQAISFLSGRTKRVADQWTPIQPFFIGDRVPPTGVFATVAFRLVAEDTNIPLKIQFSSQPDGGGLVRMAGGEAGVADLMLEGTEYIYFTVSHPSIRCHLEINAYQDSF